MCYFSFYSRIIIKKNKVIHMEEKIEPSILDWLTYMVADLFFFACLFSLMKTNY